MDINYLNEEEQFHGIFMWEKKTPEYAFYSNYSQDFEIAYEFPADVFTGMDESREDGRAYFKSKEMRDHEKAHYGVQIEGMTKEETAEWMLSHVIFQNNETDETRDFPIMWIKTVYDGKEIFLYDSLFMDSGKAVYPDGKEIGVCVIPFSEETPFDHMKDGNYDVREINQWPYFWIDEDGCVNEVEGKSII